jgi:V/A-type H+-transporting ATPase subunit D
MARLSLSKSSLGREQRQLKAFERFLPSLDLKRRQLMAERAKARRRREETQREAERRTREIGERLPMLANQEIELVNLVSISEIHLGEENIVGTRLPILDRLEVSVADYALMSKPHWVDAVVEAMRSILELRIRAQVEMQRVEQLEAAVRVVTQRVNLFDKVLIPRARKNIKRIRIYLSDVERSAVVTSKIAKSKRARAEETA